MNDYKVLDLALRTSKDWLDGVSERPVSATRDLTSLRKSIDKPLNSEGLPAQQVIEDLVTDTDGGLLGSTGGRFFCLGYWWRTSISFSCRLACFSLGPKRKNLQMQSLCQHY